jgi:hypothetical protein
MMTDSGRDESRCDDCGGVNPVWFAPNELWNLVIGGPEAKGDPGGFICPTCFIARAEASGVRPTAWELRPEEDTQPAFPPPTCDKCGLPHRPDYNCSAGPQTTTQKGSDNA